MGLRMWGRHIRNTSSIRAFAVLFTLALLPGGCFGETFQRGYVLPDGALEQIPLGASQEQVLLVLGTPSTVATVSGEAFYYISQKAQRPISFVDTTITDQRVIVVYFDKSRKVQRLAEYGMKDGKVSTSSAARRRPAAPRTTSSPTCSGPSKAKVLKRPRLLSLRGPRAPARRPSDDAMHERQCASTASSSNATMLVILIIGLTAGPAVSL